MAGPEDARAYTFASLMDVDVDDQAEVGANPESCTSKQRNGVHYSGFE